MVKASEQLLAKERGFGGASEDNAKFDSPWRRDGPLPDLHDSRDSSRRRFDGPSDRADRQVSSAADGVDQWRSNKPQRIPDSDAPPFKRKGSGFLSSEGQASAADKDEVWAIGSKFKSTTNEANDDISGRSNRIRGDMGPPREVPSDEGDWRSAARQPKPVPTGRSSISREYYQ